MTAVLITVAAAPVVICEVIIHVVAVETRPAESVIMERRDAVRPRVVGIDVDPAGGAPLQAQQQAVVAGRSATVRDRQRAHGPAAHRILEEQDPPLVDVAVGRAHCVRARVQRIRASRYGNLDTVQGCRYRHRADAVGIGPAREEERRVARSALDHVDRMPPHVGRRRQPVLPELLLQRQVPVLRL